MTYLDNEAKAREMETSSLENTKNRPSVAHFAALTTHKDDSSYRFSGELAPPQQLHKTQNTVVTHQMTHPERERRTQNRELRDQSKTRASSSTFTFLRGVPGSRSEERALSSPKSAERCKRLD